MKLLPKEAERLAKSLSLKFKKPWPFLEVVLCPDFSALSLVARIIKTSALKLGAQDLAASSLGAHTGEVAGESLLSLGASHVIIGHSERRAEGESDEAVNKKVLRALSLKKISPVICLGESLSQRKSGQAFKIVSGQLARALKGVKLGPRDRLFVAYEPIWAIGTGHAITPEEAGKMHDYLRSLLIKKFGSKAKNNCFLLYGGSVEPANSSALACLKNVDGFLVGGASLKVKSFMAIAQSFYE